MLVVLLVVDFVQLSFLVLDVFDHLAHGQAQVLTFFERVDDLLVKCHFSLPNCMVVSQVRQVHVAGAIYVED